METSIWDQHVRERLWENSVYIFFKRFFPGEIIEIIVKIAKEGYILSHEYMSNLLMIQNLNRFNLGPEGLNEKDLPIRQFNEIYQKIKYFKCLDHSFSRIPFYSFGKKKYNTEDTYELLLVKQFTIGPTAENIKMISEIEKKYNLVEKISIYKKLFVRGFFQYILDDSTPGETEFEEKIKMLKKIDLSWLNKENIYFFINSEPFLLNLIPNNIIDEGMVANIFDNYSYEYREILKNKGFPDENQGFPSENPFQKNLNYIPSDKEEFLLMLKTSEYINIPLTFPKIDYFDECVDAIICNKHLLCFDYNSFTLEISKILEKDFIRSITMARNNINFLLNLIPEFLNEEIILKNGVSKDLFFYLDGMVENYPSEHPVVKYYLESALLFDNKFWGERICQLLYDDRENLKKFVFRDGAILANFYYELYDMELVSLAMITYPQIYYIVSEDMRKIIKPLYDISFRHHFRQKSIKF